MSPLAASTPVSGDGLLRRPGRPFMRRRVETDGGPIAYAQVGTGDRLVVLVHGVLTALDDMLMALADGLADYRIIALDRPGFGQSPRRTGLDAGVLRQARRLNQALEALNLGPAVLVGHSFGAPVALAMAMPLPSASMAWCRWPPWSCPKRGWSNCCLDRAARRCSAVGCRVGATRA